MSDGLGVLAKFGLKAVAGWDAAYAAVDTFIPFTDEGLSHSWQRVKDQALVGKGGKLPSQRGNKVVTGGMNYPLDYDNFGTIFKAVLGAEAGGVYTIVDRLEQWLWLEIDKDIARHRFGAAKAMKMTLSGTAGEQIKLAVEYAMRDQTVVATAFPALTEPTILPIMMEDLVFRVADQVNALAGGDAIGISAFELSFDRAPKSDDYHTGTSPELALEAVENAKRTVTLKITLARYSSTEPFTAWKSSSPETALQGDLVFTGPAGATLLVEMPELRIIDGFDSPIGGPSIPTMKGTFEVSRTVNAAHPMSPANNNEFILTTT